MTNTTDHLTAWKADRAALLAELTAAGADVRRDNAIRCPWKDAHTNGDKNPSGAIYRTDAGTWAFKCHGCGFNGSVVDVLSRADGRTVEQVIRDHRANAAPQTRRTPEPTRESAEPRERDTRRFSDAQAIGNHFGEGTKVYSYTNPATDRADLIVVRTAGKKFLQLRQADDGDGYVFGACEKPLPIYARKRIAAAKRIVVVEGEKCVHALATLGIVATTSPGGALKAEHADWSPLAGKDVWLWPDADPPCDTYPRGKGVAHMEQVAAVLAKLPNPPRVWTVDPFEINLPPKGDAADLIEDNADAKVAVQQVLSAASPPESPSSPLAERMESMIAGKFVAVPWANFKSLTSLTNALLPGTVTLLCGEPGDGKSFLALQSVAWWSLNGIPCAYYELEEDLGWHLNRAIVQLEADKRYLDTEWAAANPEEFRAAYARQQSNLDTIAANIWDAPDDHPTLGDICEWVEQRAREGRRVIVVDPITGAKAGENRHLADEEAAKRIKVTARTYGCSVILITHPKLGSKGGTDVRHSLAGGAAWPRHSQCVMWLRMLGKPKRFQVHTDFGPTVVYAERVMKLGKTRNGSGSGAEIAFNLDPQSLTFREAGVVAGEAPDVSDVEAVG